MSVVAVMMVMPAVGLGRQGHGAYHQTADEEATYNPFYHPLALSAHIMIRWTSECKGKLCMLQVGFTTANLRSRLLVVIVHKLLFVVSVKIDHADLVA